jgi:hypothetical protein
MKSFKKTDWNAMQAYKGEPAASDVNTKAMSGGSWRADLSKKGAKRVKSSGAGSKR